MKQTRQARHASNLFKYMDPAKRTLMRANASQCGRASFHCSLKTVRAIATMVCPSAMAHDETSEASLFCAATLNRFGLPHDYAKLEGMVLPETCACYSAPLWDPSLTANKAVRIYVWQSHLGRYKGDGRRHRAHETVKLAIKRLVLANSDTARCAFPKKSILIEPPHPRQDKSRPWDIYAIGNGFNKKDSVMDIVVTSAMQRSCLSQSSTPGKPEVRIKRTWSTKGNETMFPTLAGP